MSEKKLSARMRTYYIVIVSVIVIISACALTGILLLLDVLNLIRTVGPATIIALVVVSIVTVALMSYFVGRRILMPMVKLSKASKEVARGNFNITVSDSSKLEEVQSTYRNFNAMVRELNSISTLSNDFIANVSHEFKTPLTAIEGYASLLQEENLPPEEREDYIERILSNTKRLSTLIGNILTLSKVESKPLPGQYTRFRLDEQLRQTVVAAEPSWTQKELKIKVDFDEVMINGCEGLLAQVWSNLLENAVKFSPAGGTVQLRLIVQQECVLVSVSDQGCGMSDEVRAHIFDKFYQGDTSHRSEGNGLGLALVKRIVELSDGIVEVESVPEQGTTFRVILPK